MFTECNYCRFACSCCDGDEYDCHDCHYPRDHFILNREKAKTCPMVGVRKVEEENESKDA